ncbi:DUF6931 family protein [Bosea sp. (in: a-proteobacteria)]|uniref:DUF6931 family protein n=1 Tax=Bosea sp. (in: a-proteobacteria) TaxID=1871050 RepID=UPI003B3ABEFD
MSGLRFQTAAEVFEAFPDMADDMVSGPADTPPVAFVAQLQATASPEDAITFCAYALDRRRAVWWALECSRTLDPPTTSEAEIALRTAEAWVREPEEYRRLAALRIGMTGRRDLSATWVSLAAGGSGGTLATGAEPGPPVPPQMCAKAARAATLIALSTIPVRERKAQLGRCLDIFRNLVKTD